MPTSDNLLAIKIREKISECLRNGNTVEAIKFYHEVTLTPLVEAKQRVESVRADNKLPIIDERFEPFLNFLAERDFGGAAAFLCADQRLPSDAIETTIRIARLLNVDVTTLELPASTGLSLSDSPQAQSIINERALELVRQRMVRRLVQGGTSREEAEKLIGNVHQELATGLAVSPKPGAVSFEGVDPQLARVVRLLLGPVPLVSNPALQPSNHHTIPSTQRPDKGTVVNRPFVLITRVGKLAGLAYALFAIVGVGLLGYSNSSSPQLVPFSMSQGLALPEQEAVINTWIDQNLPATSPWFISSVSDQFFPVRLEPGLPVAYAGEDWTWEQKIVSINNSADEIVARLKRCHEVLFVLYSIAILLAVFHWFNRNIISGILMVLTGVLGIPFLVTQVWRMEFDNPLWLGLLLIPGTIALIAAVLELAWFAPNTDRRKELRAFWLGALAFVVAGLFLGWAIVEGTHLRPAAGLGVFGGAWLMLLHGWRYLRGRD